MTRAHPRTHTPAAVGAGGVRAWAVGMAPVRAGLFPRPSIANALRSARQQ
jgi:hypothetical protein